MALLISCSFFAQAQVQTPTSGAQGHISAGSGQPLAGVAVGVKGTTLGASTDEKGDYRIEGLTPGTYTLGARLVGFTSQEHRVRVSAGETAAQNFMLSESTEQLSEVVVEGKQANKFARKQSEYVAKMPLKNLENPQVYSTIGKELLSEQLVFSVDEAMRNAPGVQKMWEATGRAGDGGSFYNSRGFVVQSQLRNGIAGNVTSDIDAVNLEKLEVIKGPSATLFGSALTSYGGLINRVTKRPTDSFGGEVSMAAGSYGFHRVSADVNLVDANAPAVQPKALAFRLNTAYTYEDNFQSQGFAKNLAVAPSLTYRPTDRLTINVDAELYQSRNVGKQLIFFYYPTAQLGFDRADKAPVDYRNSYTGGGLTQTSRSANFFGQVNYRIAPGFTSSTNLTSSHSYSNGFGPYFYFLPDVALDSTAGPGTHHLARADQSTNNSRNQVFEVQQLFNGDFRLGGLRHRAVLGLDFLRVDSDIEFFGGAGDVVPLGVPGYDYGRTFNGGALTSFYATLTQKSTYPVTTKANTYSAFASDVLNLTDQLSVLAALRLDHYDNKGGLLYVPVQAYSQTTLSPKFGAVFQPVLDRVALFANYQNSFINRGAYLGTEQQPTDAPRIAKPEQANQVEAGVKLDAASGKVSATVSYYDVRVKNILRDTPTLTNPQAKTQNGTQLSKGVELSVIANPLPGLNVVGGFSYNRSALTRSTDDVNNRRPGTASSPYLANLWLSYRLPEGKLRGLGTGAGGNYASDNKIVNSVSMGTFTLPAYMVLNASVFFDQPRYRLSAKVDNLTNQRYWIGYTTMSPQKLRSVVGSVAYKF
ncbi:TonB-dependent siderophore receptor [Hymenobacter persicinus]|uniref:TonB-dependent siderophore receptor n=2 Tax=Hymenobacter persicinus TaxID=2025506 RepID=A0A4Q5LE21_9BACT|nr:TonB-dependent siderophore receptor [Hymenobacter persicinus]